MLVATQAARQERDRASSFVNRWKPLVQQGFRLATRTHVWYNVGMLAAVPFTASERLATAVGGGSQRGRRTPTARMSATGCWPPG
jgi:hypothetical protein